MDHWRDVERPLQLEEQDLLSALFCLSLEPVVTQLDIDTALGVDPPE